MLTYDDQTRCIERLEVELQELCMLALICPRWPGSCSCSGKCQACTAHARIKAWAHKETRAPDANALDDWKAEAIAQSQRAVALVDECADLTERLYAAQEQIRECGIEPRPPLGFAPEPCAGSRRWFETRVEALETRVRFLEDREQHLLNAVDTELGRRRAVQERFDAFKGALKELLR